MSEEIENNDPELLNPSSPPSPVTKKSSRRSSMAAARRLSRASTMGAALFEDLLAAIPGKDEASTKERVEKLLQLVISSSVRSAVDSCKDDEDEDLEDVAKDVSLLVRNSRVSEEVVADVVKVIDEGLEIEGDAVGGELKKIRDYTKNLEEEGVKWKELLAERNEIYKNASKNAKAVSSGELCINDDMKWSLSSEERLRLSKITENCKAAVNQLNSAASSETVEVMLRSISTSCVRQQAELRHNNDKLGLAVRQLTSRADLVADKL